MKNNLYIGIMSGTSMDGVDVALCEIDDTSCKLVHFAEYPFPKNLKSELLELINGVTTLREIGLLHSKLGHLFADKVLEFFSTYKINPSDIKAIGLHGQTLWHEPFGEFPFSTQLGDANVLVAKCRVRAVSDFRNMDIAKGGQGAPFAPAFHKFLFFNLGKNVAVLNIGGMANITILGDLLEGWDTGCGNVLLDMWIKQTQDKAYDKDGDFARSGTVDEALLAKMLDDEYFKKSAPKSAGRELFNQNWLANFLPIFNTIKAEDIQRTLLELTAKSVANDLKNRKITTLIVCGGGAKNIFLMERLQALCDCDVTCSEDFGVRSDALEAMAFAWFAYKRVNNEVVELSFVTGAREDSILGAIYG